MQTISQTNKDTMYMKYKDIWHCYTNLSQLKYKLHLLSLHWLCKKQIKLLQFDIEIKFKNCTGYLIKSIPSQRVVRFCALALLSSSLEEENDQLLLDGTLANGRVTFSWFSWLGWENADTEVLCSKSHKHIICPRWDLNQRPFT